MNFKRKADGTDGAAPAPAPGTLHAATTPAPTGFMATAPTNPTPAPLATNMFGGAAPTSTPAAPAPAISNQPRMNTTTTTTTFTSNNNSNATAAGVVRSTGDPTDEVRTTLANLTARAKQLVLDDTDLRVVRNGRSLYEMSRKTSDEARQRIKQSSTMVEDGFSGGHIASAATQASVELFMAKQLGFDMLEQQRLLQQLQASQGQMAADLSSADPAALGGLGAYYSPSEGGIGAGASLGTAAAGSEVDAVVARLKGDHILQAQNAVHQREKDQIRDQEYAIFKAAWNQYHVGIADDLEGLALRRAGASASGAACDRGVMSASVATASGAATDFIDKARPSSTGLVSLLASASPLATEINHKADAFATIVNSYLPTQWISYFTSYVTEQAVRSGDELAVLWATTEQMLEPVLRKGSAATPMSYVASSRYVMERKAFSRLLTSTMRIDPSRFDEVAGMNATRVLEIIARASGTANAWVHAFMAMRSGRYDVAVLAAQQIGSAALSAALKKYADASPSDRNSTPSAVDLQVLYAEAATRADPFRHAVLFLLLVGRTGENSEAAVQVLMTLSNSVATSLEDALWLRLACVRSVDELDEGMPSGLRGARGGAKHPITGGGKVQSLAYVQKVIVEDLRDLVTVTHGNIPRLASFLLHALLPSTGLRLLLEKDATYVDGIHLALCFNACNLLQSSAAETPLDLARHLSRYTTLVLMDGGRRSTRAASAYAGNAAFNYFHKTGFDEAFTELCQRESVCATLLGHYGYAMGTGGDALLLVGTNAAPTVVSASSTTGGGSSGSSPPVSEDLMVAIRNVAEMAASRNNAPMAIHVFLVLAHAAAAAAAASGACTGGKDEETMKRALRRAVHVACPAAVQVFHLPPHTNFVASLCGQMSQLRSVLRSLVVDTSDILSHADAETFEVLTIMADAFMANATGDAEQTVSHFFRLPFVPTSATTAEMDRCVHDFCSSSSHYVIAAGSAIIPITLRATSTMVQAYYAEYHRAHETSRTAAAAAQRATALKQHMQTVCEWVKRCCAQPGPAYRECPKEVVDFEQRYLLA